MRVCAAILAFSLMFGYSTHASSAASVQAQALPSDVLSKALQLIAAEGTDRPLAPNFANALGFAPAGQSWPYRSVSVGHYESGTAHTFAIHQGSAPDLLIINRIGNIVLAFRAQRDGQVIAAFRYDAGTGQITMRVPADAQADLNAEFSFWTGNVDLTLVWAECQGQLKGGHPVSKEKKIENCTRLIDSGKLPPVDLAAAYVDRSQAYSFDTESAKVLDDRNAAVKADPTSASAWAELCSAVGYFSHYNQESMDDCGKAIALDPKLPEAWTYRADIRLNLGQYDQAIADYNQAIALDPKWMWPWDNRGEAYLRQSQIDRAVQDFDQVIQLNPDYAMGFLDRGIARMRQKNLDAALADFQAGIKIDSDCGPCFVGRGLVELSKGDAAAGNADIAKGKGMSPHVAEDFTKDGIPVP